MNLVLESAPEAGPMTAPAVEFEALYRDSRDDLFAYVAGLLRDRALAEDVTALAFERAYRKWGKFDPARGSARGWLFGIARNAALDELRRRRRETALTREPADAAAEVAGREPDERALAVRQAVDGLIPAERELVSLKFFAGLNNREIAETLGISETNVGTRLSRVVAKLREVLR